MPTNTYISTVIITVPLSLTHRHVPFLGLTKTHLTVLSPTFWSLKSFVTTQVFNPPCLVGKHLSSRAFNLSFIKFIMLFRKIIFSRKSVCSLAHNFDTFSTQKRSSFYRHMGRTLWGRVFPPLQPQQRFLCFLSPHDFPVQYPAAREETTKYRVDSRVLGEDGKSPEKSVLRSKKICKSETWRSLEAGQSAQLSSWWRGEPSWNCSREQGNNYRALVPFWLLVWRPNRWGLWDREVEWRALARSGVAYLDHLYGITTALQFRDNCYKIAFRFMQWLEGIFTVLTIYFLNCDSFFFFWDCWFWKIVLTQGFLHFFLVVYFHFWLRAGSIVNTRIIVVNFCCVVLYYLAWRRDVCWLCLLHH